MPFFTHTLVHAWLVIRTHCWPTNNRYSLPATVLAQIDGRRTICGKTQGCDSTAAPDNWLALLEKVTLSGERK